MSKKSIPKEVKALLDERVKAFNEKVIGNPNVYYLTRYRGRYLYLDRFDYGRKGAICRLSYDGDINDLEFAIFKYSSEKYDPDEWMFPGSGNIDGTVEGAMRAGLEAYSA